MGSGSVLVEGSYPSPDHREMGSRCPARLLRRRKEYAGCQSSETYKTQSPPHRPLPPGSVWSLTPEGHTHRSTRPALASTLHTVPPPPPPAAVHLLVPSALVRPSICLHTFGGNLWVRLRGSLNPSLPPSLPALRNGEEAAEGLWEEGRGSDSGTEKAGLNLATHVSGSVSLPLRALPEVHFWAQTVHGTSSLCNPLAEPQPRSQGPLIC